MPIYRLADRLLSVNPTRLLNVRRRNLDAPHPTGGYDEILRFENGSIAYLRDGALHREDGPAHIDSDGGQTWLRHGREHRDSGPAVVYSDGTSEYWLKGVRVSEDVWLRDRAQEPRPRGIRRLVQASAPLAARLGLAG